MTQPTLIEAHGLGVRAGRRWLIHNIDMAVTAGEIVTIIGPNGAGKTTMARALIGLVKPSAGSVTRRPDLTIGYVPQRLAIDPTLPLTVMRLMTLVKPATRQAIIDSLDHTQMAHVIDQPLQTLSGGEMQRVLLARALLHKPDLLILDEPVQGVDFAGQAELYRLIAATRDEIGCGVVMISHDLHVVMGATDRVICLNGHVCCSGAPQEVTKHPEYQRLFGQQAIDAYAIYQHQGHEIPHRSPSEQK
ncbi:MAG: metal ABC transporter ATP-binding protein [Pseudomonadota bacterium]